MADENQSNTPLLDAIVAESGIAREDLIVPMKNGEAVETFIRAHNARVAMRGFCRWEPCSFVLFGLAGETHEEYHKRKGTC